MDKFDELLEQLNSLKIIQELRDWEECLPEDVWKKHFNDYEYVANGLDVYKHRHYETSISVIKIYGRLLGIRHITDVFSEQTSVSDCFFQLEFFEMDVQQTVTYVKI